MSAYTVELPESLHRNIKAVADEGGYTVDQFLATAAAEKIAAFKTLAYLQNEAAQARREDFEKFLAAVPARPVPESDRVE